MAQKLPPIAVKSLGTDLYGSSRCLSFVCLAVLVAASVILFLTAPRHGEFWWSETSRNALDGAFVYDLVRELPLSDPKGWAVRYYLQYPALTILIYPPLYHVALAIFYSIFGVRHSAAVLCTATFAFAASAACYAIVRRLASHGTALMAALLLLASPQVMTWSQQVMPEAPMLALALWATFFVLRYGDEGHPRDLWVALTFLLAALYTKETAAFGLFGVLVALIVWKGVSIIRCPHVIAAGAVGFVVLLPLAAMKWVFNQWTFSRVAGAGDNPDAGLTGIFYYALHLGEAASYAVFGLALAWIIGAIIRRNWRPPHGDLLVWSLWFGSNYVLLTALPFKEDRYGILLIPPVVIAGSLFMANIIQTRSEERLSATREFAFPAIGIAAFAWTTVAAPTPLITGYREAADRIAKLAPQNGRVVFAGTHDGSFIFNLRQYHNNHHLTVIRADKLYLNIVVQPAFGLNPKAYTETEIGEMLKRFGASYVVTVPRIWAETKVMANFAKVLESPQFEEIERLPVRGATAEKELIIYRNKGPLKDPPDDFSVELGVIGAKFRS